MPTDAINDKQELTGIIGFVDNSEVQSIKDGTVQTDTITLNFEATNDEIKFFVKVADILKVSPGAVTGEKTRLTLVLKSGSVVHTYIKALHDIKALNDPTLGRLTAACVQPVSFV